MRTWTLGIHTCSAYFSVGQPLQHEFDATIKLEKQNNIEVILVIVHCQDNEDMIMDLPKNMSRTTSEVMD